MRKRLLIAFGCSLSIAALGQGTVRFSNSSADLSSPPDRLIWLGALLSPFHTNTPLVNLYTQSWRAQLYYGASTASDASLIPLTASPALFRSSTTTAEPGTWAPGTRTFIGFDTGETLNLQVRVWDNQYGSTWELAGQNGTPYIGKSAIFRYTIPSPGTGPVSAYAMSQFVGFIIDVPEPGSLALTVLGLGSLLMFQRRKRGIIKKTLRV